MAVGLFSFLTDGKMAFTGGIVGNLNNFAYEPKNRPYKT
jgi:hypothetical protein